MGFLIILIFLQSPDSIEVKKGKKIQDPWFGEDKLYHLTVASLMTGAFYHLFYCKMEIEEKTSITSSLGIVVTASISKEIWDKKRGKFFSYKDLLFDIAGIVVGYLIFIK